MADLLLVELVGTVSIFLFVGRLIRQVFRDVTEVEPRGGS